MHKQIKTTYGFFGASILSEILHNIIQAGTQEPENFFLILGLVLILGFVISIIYNVVTLIKKGQPKDLWKLGWIGLFGLVGLLGEPGLYGLFGFFGFFGFKK